MGGRKKSGRNTPVSINLSLYAESPENIADVIRSVYENLTAKATEEGMSPTEEEPFHYVKGGYRYMPDSGFILGMPYPSVGDRIVWERYEDNRLYIGEVLELKERQLDVLFDFAPLTIGNSWVRGVLK